MENYEGQNSRIGKVGQIGDEYESQNKIDKMKWLVVEDQKLEGDIFNEKYVDPLIKEDGTVWGAVKVHNFERVVAELLDRGYNKVTVSDMVRDPETVPTYIIEAL
jgi:hypothetical protein